MTQVFEARTTVEQWDEDYYQPIALRLYDRAIRDMLRAMAVDRDAVVLDAGCGPGVHSIRVARAGHRVRAVDISRTMLNEAQQRVAEQGLTERVEFSRQDLTKLDFADASFRYVFSWGVVIHIPEAEKALDELARIVEPGGKLALYVTNKAALDHRIESLARLALRKPLTGMQHLPLGDGIWYEMGGEKLWLWRFDAHAIAAFLGKRRFRLIERRTGEFSEIQRRVRGPARNLLLRLNNLAYRMGVPATWAASQLLVFEKGRE
jgi:ubiquinone/menaquinone biosynthesis C-methylase UbiE